ncbi:3-hydroxyacyl-ACP dehydratase FabZ family protein [Streptomyces longwoodensis]|uniref:3-hydroxyacyl-ACP dehydratase FabZ family protein n=1 Tax=Streptomyces longwoodensis TaxID=68231 RepID=UPI0033D84E00
MMQRPFCAPLTAVDSVNTESDSGVSASKVIKADDPYLCGHYPHFTIYPGIFIIESVGQAVRAHVAAHRGATYGADLVEVSRVRFTAPLLPGNTLELDAQITPGEQDPDLLSVKAQARREDGARCAAMTLTFRLEDRRA